MRAFLTFCLVVAPFMPGCGGSAVDPQVEALRSALLVSSRPSDGLSIQEAKEAVADIPAEIVLNAQVTSGEYAYWESQSAAFAVSEVLEDDGHGGEGHDPSNCPFCKRRLAELKDRRAMVKIVDESGEVIPMDARKLLGIEENQRIVLQGAAQVDKAGNLVMAAERVFIEPES